jgi:hypothetical protein
MVHAFLLTAAAAVGFFVAGCDDGYDSPPATTDPAPISEGVNEGVSVDIDAGETALDNRAERRAERRENLREAVDGVDVKVDENGVDVDVE